LQIDSARTKRTGEIILVRVVFDSDIAFLAQDFDFMAKVQNKYAQSNGWSFRVHKKGVGYIHFQPDGATNNQVIHAYKED
jgi:hypothetical protein